MNELSMVVVNDYQMVINKCLNGKLTKINMRNCFKPLLESRQRRRQNHFQSTQTKRLWLALKLKGDSVREIELLSAEELESVNGGDGFWLGVAASLAASVIYDGVKYLVANADNYNGAETVLPPIGT